MTTGKSEGTRTFPPCPSGTGSLPYPVAGTLPSGRESTPSEKPEFDHLGTLRALRDGPLCEVPPLGVAPSPGGGASDRDARQVCSSLQGLGAERHMEGTVDPQQGRSQTAHPTTGWALNGLGGSAAQLHQRGTPCRVPCSMF